MFEAGVFASRFELVLLSDEEDVGGSGGGGDDDDDDDWSSRRRVESSLVFFLLHFRVAGRYRHSPVRPFARPPVQSQWKCGGGDSLTHSLTC